MTVDLSSITALANPQTVEFRITDESTTAVNSTSPVATTGTDRVDDFDVEGVAASLIPLAVGKRRRGRPAD